MSQNPLDNAPLLYSTTQESTDGVIIGVMLGQNDHAVVTLCDPEGEADQRLNLLGDDLESLGRALLETAEQRKKS